MPRWIDQDSSGARAGWRCGAAGGGDPVLQPAKRRHADGDDEGDRQQSVHRRGGHCGGDHGGHDVQRAPAVHHAEAAIDRHQHAASACRARRLIHRRVVGIGARHHRRQQFDRAVGQDDAEHMAAGGQRRVATAGRLRDQVAAAAAHQRAGLRRIAQGGEGEEEGGVGGAALPGGEEQCQRLRGGRDADQAGSDQGQEQDLGIAALIGELEEQEAENGETGERPGLGQVQQLRRQRGGPGEDVAPGAHASAVSTHGRARHATRQSRLRKRTRFDA